MSFRLLDVRIIAPFSAILVNFMIFMWISTLGQQDYPGNRKDCSSPVSISTWEPPTSSSPEERKKRSVTTSSRPEKIPRVTSLKRTVQYEQPDIVLPVPHIEINPRLVTGLEMSWSPVHETGSPSVNLAREFEAGEVDQTPVPIRRIDPLYPYAARVRGITGKVVVKFLVDSQGRVSKINVLESEPKGVFEKNVISALQRWQFSPGLYMGRPVATWVVVPFEFRLQG